MEDDSVPFSPSAFATWLRHYGSWFGLADEDIEKVIHAVETELKGPADDPAVPSPFRLGS